MGHPSALLQGLIPTGSLNVCSPFSSPSSANHCVPLILPSCCLASVSAPFCPFSLDDCQCFLLPSLPPTLPTTCVAARVGFLQIYQSLSYLVRLMVPCCPQDTTPSLRWPCSSFHPSPPLPFTCSNSSPRPQSTLQFLDGASLPLASRLLLFLHPQSSGLPSILPGGHSLEVTSFEWSHLSTLSWSRDPALRFTVTLSTSPVCLHPPPSHWSLLLSSGTSLF